MHELSIASRLVEIATEISENEGVNSVVSVTIRVGSLSCVNAVSLRSCFDLVAEGTLLQGARLNIVDLPVVIYCSNCKSDVELPGIQNFCCPVCKTPGADIRQGNELEIESIEVLDR